MKKEQVWCNGKMKYQNRVIVHKTKSQKYSRSHILKIKENKIQEIPTCKLSENLQHGQLKAFVDTITLLEEIKNRAKRI